MLHHFAYGSFDVLDFREVRLPSSRWHDVEGQSLSSLSDHVEHVFVEEFVREFSRVFLSEDRLIVCWDLFHLS